MRTSSLVASLLTLSTLLLSAGCNGSKSTRALVDTKSIYQVSASDTLTIHIEDAPSDDANESAAPQENQPGTSVPSDLPPVVEVTANGGSHFVTVHTGEPVHFSAASSYDPDGEIVQYIWTDMDHNVLSSDINFTRTFYEPAVYEKTVTAIDNQGNATRQQICVLADITPEDIPLMANAGPDIVVPEGTPVSITGHVVCKEGQFEYEWHENGILLSSDATLNHTFTPGVHYAILRVHDLQNDTYAFDETVITVRRSTFTGE